MAFVPTPSWNLKKVKQFTELRRILRTGIWWLKNIFVRQKVFWSYFSTFAFKPSYWIWPFQPPMSILHLLFPFFSHILLVFVWKSSTTLKELLAVHMLRIHSVHNWIYISRSFFIICTCNYRSFYSKVKQWNVIGNTLAGSSIQHADKGKPIRMLFTSQARVLYMYCMFSFANRLR